MPLWILVHHTLFSRIEDVNMRRIVLFEENGGCTPYSTTGMNDILENSMSNFTLDTEDSGAST
jgi:hypothetical protein